jgi:hypothetical protein
MSLARAVHVTPASTGGFTAGELPNSCNTYSISNYKSSSLSGLASGQMRSCIRPQELSLPDIAGRLVIATGKKKGQHPSPATV